MKKITALVLAVLMALTLFTACGATKSTSSSSSAAATSSSSAASSSAASSSKASSSAASSSSSEAVKGEVTVWYPDSWQQDAPDFVSTWKSQIAAKYPDVKVTFEEYVQSGILEKLTVAMATGTTPDVFYDVQSRISAAANAGLLADLSDVGSELSSKFTGSYLDSGKYDGKTLYLPFDSLNCYSVAINMDIAKKIGADKYLPTDSIHWSYDDFLKCCELAKNAGYYGTQLWAGGPTGDAAMYSLYMTAGSKLFSDDFNSCTINNDGTKKALELLKTLIDKEYVPAGAATQIDYNEAFFAEKSLFSLPQGGSAIIISRDNSLKKGDISSTFNMDFALYPTPDGKSEPISASFGTNGFCVFKNSGNADNIAASKAIIKLLYDDPTAMDGLLTTTGESPVISTASATVDAKYTDVVKKGYDLNAKYSTSSFGIQQGWWSDWRSAYFPVMQNFYSGAASVDDTLTALQDAGNKVIADYKAANSSSSSKS